jgi:hypothetical protein
MPTAIHNFAAHSSGGGGGAGRGGGGGSGITSRRSLRRPPGWAAARSLGVATLAMLALLLLLISAPADVSAQPSCNSDGAHPCWVRFQHSLAWIASFLAFI